MMGMESVDVSGLEVALWARDEDLRKDKSVDKSDQGICRALRAPLINDPCISMVAIVINASDGRVTMNGTVDNLKAKRAPVSDVHNTVGVRYVRNNIVIGPEQPLTDA
jgi:osmotically-inducible protein OsmY